MTLMASAAMSELPGKNDCPGFILHEAVPEPKTQVLCRCISGGSMETPELSACDTSTVVSDNGSLYGDSEDELDAEVNALGYLDFVRQSHPDIDAEADALPTFEWTRQSHTVEEYASGVDTADGVQVQTSTPRVRKDQDALKVGERVEVFGFDTDAFMQWNGLVGTITALRGSSRCVVELEKENNASCCSEFTFNRSELRRYAEDQCMQRPATEGEYCIGARVLFHGLEFPSKYDGHTGKITQITVTGLCRVSLPGFPNDPIVPPEDLSIVDVMSVGAGGGEQENLQDALGKQTPAAPVLRPLSPAPTFDEPMPQLSLPTTAVFLDERDVV